ncbi:MAG TPA: hypothetical protein VMF57_20310 [Solirubrobacteraceae bacterium]|nr:hypothetical protein [Solirubrobacteraceae bacterium]
MAVIRARADQLGERQLSVTLLARDHVPTDDYDAVEKHFSPDEVAALVSLIVAINAWNAIAVFTRAWVPGSYES